MNLAVVATFGFDFLVLICFRKTSPTRKQPPSNFQGKYSDVLIFSRKEEEEEEEEEEDDQ